MPGFLDTWNSADLEKIVPTSIFAFDKTSGELVGILMAQSNLYQLWSDEPLTHMNVDTVIIKKEYAGKEYSQHYTTLVNRFRLRCTATITLKGLQSGQTTIGQLRLFFPIHLRLELISWSRNES